MPVLSPHKAWPDSRVPYTAATPEIDGWLQEINAAIGFPLLVAKGVSDFDYISAERGDGKSETIGYEKSKGKHKITAQKKFSMQHELLHALGFHHEQLHRDGPWGNFGTKASSADKIDKELLTKWGLNMLPEASRIQAAEATPKKAVTAEEPSKKKSETVPTLGRRNSLASGDKPKLATNQEAIAQHKRAYQDALGDNNILHYLSCDFDSVMMYSEMCAAAKSCQLQSKMVFTGKHPKAPCLSKGDVAALQYLYQCKILTVYAPPLQLV